MSARWTVDKYKKKDDCITYIQNKQANKCPEASNQIRQSVLF